MIERSSSTCEAPPRHEQATVVDECIDVSVRILSSNRATPTRAPTPCQSNTYVYALRDTVCDFALMVTH